MVFADARTAITFALSPGQANEEVEGRKLFNSLGEPNWSIHLLMDKAYEGDEIRQLAVNQRPILSTSQRPIVSNLSVC